MAQKRAMTADLALWIQIDPAMISKSTICCSAVVVGSMNSTIMLFGAAMTFFLLQVCLLQLQLEFLLCALLRLTVGLPCRAAH